MQATAYAAQPAQDTAKLREQTAKNPAQYAPQLSTLHDMLSKGKSMDNINFDQATMEAIDACCGGACMTGNGKNYEGNKKDIVKTATSHNYASETNVPEVREITPTFAFSEPSETSTASFDKSEPQNTTSYNASQPESQIQQHEEYHVPKRNGKQTSQKSDAVYQENSHAASESKAETSNSKYNASDFDSVVSLKDFRESYAAKNSSIESKADSDYTSRQEQDTSTGTVLQFEQPKEAYDTKNATAEQSQPETYQHKEAEQLPNGRSNPALESLVQTRISEDINVPNNTFDCFYTFSFNTTPDATIEHSAGANDNTTNLDTRISMYSLSHNTQETSQDRISNNNYQNKTNAQVSSAAAQELRNHDGQNYDKSSSTMHVNTKKAVNGNYRQDSKSIEDRVVSRKDNESAENDNNATEKATIEYRRSKKQIQDSNIEKAADDNYRNNQSSVNQNTSSQDYQKSTKEAVEEYYKQQNTPTKQIHESGLEGNVAKYHPQKTMQDRKDYHAQSRFSQLGNSLPDGKRYEKDEKSEYYSRRNTESYHRSGDIVSAKEVNWKDSESKKTSRRKQKKSEIKPKQAKTEYIEKKILRSKQKKEAISKKTKNGGIKNVTVDLKKNTGRNGKKVVRNTSTTRIVKKRAA